MAAQTTGFWFDSPFSVGGGNTFGEATTLILQSSIVIAGVLVLFLFVFGGFGIIMGAGNDNPDQAAKGKKAMTAALVGFIVILATYWVVRIIELIIGYNFATSPPGTI